MKPTVADKTSKRNGYQSDDDNVRYKLNTEYFNNISNSPKIRKIEKIEKSKSDDDNIRYKFPTAVFNKTRLPEQKPKPKPKIKVNFWSNKQSVNRLNNTDSIKQKTNRRHTVAASGEDTSANKAKHSAVKVRKRVSFLPSPIFSENHVPMVTVPDDLTIQLNEEEANDLAEDLNLAFVNSGSNDNKPNNSPKRKNKNTNPTNRDKQRKTEDSDTRSQGSENELEFFSKYVVQKLRRMETNQRIYSENLINTVLMLGQLGKLNGKSKITEI